MMNSAIHFVYFVFTLLVFSISSVAEELDPLFNQSRVTLFSASSKVSYVKGNGTREEKKVHSFRIPGLVEVDGVLVAITEAHYDKPDDVSSIDIVATYSVDNGKNWKEEVIIKNSGVSTVSRVVEPIVVVKGKKIYVLVGSFNISTTFWASHTNDSDWDPLLVVGEVTTSTPAEGEKTASITWGEPVSLKKVFMSKKQQFWKLFVGGTRTGLLMSNGTIVFPLQIVKSGDIFSTIMYSNDDGQTWTFAQGSQVNYGSSEPSLVEWGDKLIMSCRRENDMRRFYESSDMGATWIESYNKLSRVWGNAPDRQGPGTPGSLIAVEIEGMRVMLFSIPLNTKKGRNRDRLNLWMTDNNRIFNVGQVSHGDENTGYNSLLYHGDKLYCAHEVNNGNAFSIVLTTLENHLERIKSTVKAWKQNDKKLSDLCIPVDPAASDKERKSCGENITTSGLVGWLSGDLRDNNWKDKYSCVDAEVTNAIATPYGAEFYGSNAGALWPVSTQGQNQRYFFVNRVFTLAAIVSIQKVPEHGKIYPVMSVSFKEDDEMEYTSLSYNSNHMWVLEYGEHKINSTKSWNLNRKYHVALSLGPTDKANDNFCVYIDGERLQCEKDDIFYDYDDGIENFYIGSHQDYHKDMNGYIMVSNVMLYNRKLSDNEIMTLSRGKHMIDERTVTISPSATLSLTPSLSIDPSAHVSKTDATASSPRAGEQNTSAQMTHKASSSAPIQTNAVNEQKGSDKSANENTHAALTEHTQKTDVPSTKDNTVSVSSLPVNPTGDGGSGVVITPKNSSVDITTTKNSGVNASIKSRDSGITITSTEQRTDSNTGTNNHSVTSTSSSTSTSTSTNTSTIKPAPVAVRTNSESVDASVSDLNPSQGAESKNDSPQIESDKDKKSSDENAYKDTQTALLQPDSTALPPKEDKTVSDPFMPVNPMGNGSTAVVITPKNNSVGTKTTNISDENLLRKPKDSGSTVTSTEQRTDSKTDTSSSTSTSTSAPVEVSSNSDSSDASVSGLNLSHKADKKRDPSQDKSTALSPKKNNTVSAPSLPVNPISDGGAEESKPNGGNAGITTTNNSVSNQSREPNDSESTVTLSKQRTDSKTDTGFSTSTSTSAPLEVSSNSDSGDASVPGLNPSHGAESKSDPPQVESDEKKKSSDKSAYKDTQTDLLQPDSTSMPPKEDNAVSAPYLPVNSTSEGGSEEAKPKNSTKDTKTTNNSDSNPSRKSKDSGRTIPSTEQRTDSYMDTSSSTSTSAPLEVSSNSDSSDASVTGLNPSHGAENKSDPPQVESDKDKKTSDSLYDDAGRAHIPFTSLLLSALLGFATVC